ncbi:MAG: CHASE2 domain-containing protein [Thermoanaerobaculia bacterium]
MAVIFLGVCLGRVCEHKEMALRARYAIYQAMLHLAPQKARASRTALVMIGDAEFRGELGGRSPIRRDYLAKLIRAVDAADAQLIAIDFRLEMPPQAEDGELLAAIEEVSARRPIVLPVTLAETRDGDYQKLPQLYSKSRFSNAVRIGHIQVFEDRRPIPVGLRLADGTPLDSFAEAIVRLVDPSVLSGFEDAEDPPFATFVRRNDVLVVSASSVLRGEYTGPLGALRSKIVIVSGDWEVDALGHRHVDDQPSPAGVIPGSMVQANYVEALLGTRSYRELDENVALVLEVILAGLLAVLFERSRGWKKLSVALGLCGLTLFVGYVLLENAGLYYDFYWPVILLALHALVAEFV